MTSICISANIYKKTKSITSKDFSKLPIILQAVISYRLQRISRIDKSIIHVNKVKLKLATKISLVEAINSCLKNENYFSNLPFILKPGITKLIKRISILL